MKKLLLILIVLGLLIPTGFFFFKTITSNHPNILNSPNRHVAPTEPPVPSTVTQLMDSVNQHTALPKNEIPNVATVSDVSKLQEQPFFQKAQNGDKVLMYMVAKEAVLYRSSTGKIVEISPIEITNNVGSVSAQVTGAQFTGPALKVKM